MATTGVSTAAARWAGTGVARDQHRQPRQHRCQLEERHLADDVNQRDLGRKRLPDAVRLRTVALGAEQNNGGAVVRRECRGDRGEPLRRPLLDQPSCARIDADQWSCCGQCAASNCPAVSRAARGISNGIRFDESAAGGNCSAGSTRSTRRCAFADEWMVRVVVERIGQEGAAAAARVADARRRAPLACHQRVAPDVRLEVERQVEAVTPPGRRLGDDGP